MLGGAQWRCAAGQGDRKRLPGVAGTGFDIADQNSDTNSGRPAGNVVGGEVIKLHIAIWDASDHSRDAIAVLDHFPWSVDVIDPGTVLF